MEFSMLHHVGMRKDKLTPAFDHQLTIVSYLRTMLDQSIYPEQTITVAFLHDIIEDNPDVTPDIIEDMFGEQIAKSVCALTKKSKTIHLTTEDYYGKRMHLCPIASIVKGADRIHNHQSMVGVFDLSKQIEYIDETQNYVLPMLKTARRVFHAQEPIYENIKNILICQIDLIKEIHNQLIPKANDNEN